jgi:hypothetical protein
LQAKPINWKILLPLGTVRVDLINLGIASRWETGLVAPYSANGLWR